MRDVIPFIFVMDNAHTHKKAFHSMIVSMVVEFNNIQRAINHHDQAGALAAWPLALSFSLA